MKNLKQSFNKLRKNLNKSEQIHLIGGRPPKGLEVKAPEG